MEKDLTGKDSEPSELIYFKGKRLGNTPFRREACVVKWLDE